MKINLINFVLFQIGWFACVMSAANYIPLIGLCFAIIIMFIHIKLSPNPTNEIILLIVAMVIGLVWDSFIVYAGWINYTSGMMSNYLAPYWIIALWGLFATTVNVSLNWLKEKTIIAMLFGAIAGPLAYYAGYKLGALTFTDFNMAMIALSIGWAIFTPFLLSFTDLYHHYVQNKMRATS